VVTDPGIINPKEFIDTVLHVRFPNPFMPDAPQRIATDTSQKLPIRFGETIKAYLASDTLDVNDLKLIPLVFAGWLRYLMAVNDSGEAFEPSPDPLLSTAQPYVAQFKLGDTPSVEELKEKLSGLLGNAAIFGVNLYEAGLADNVCGYYAELISGTGAVRSTLKKYLAEV
jgi:fructuronate reductase